MKKETGNAHEHAQSLQTRRRFLSASALIGVGAVAFSIPGSSVLAKGFDNLIVSDNEVLDIFDPEPKVWLVTGANRGNGLGIVRAALESGHKVAITTRRPATVPADLKSHPNAIVLELDVTKPKTIKRAVGRAISHFGRIDVLINNAGYGQLGWFENTSEKQVRDQFETNVFGTMNVTRAVLPYLRKQKSGQIFSVTSVAGLVSVAGSSTYSASKFALEGWMEGLADELKPLGISVTSIEPGFFRTDFLDRSSAIYSATSIEDYNPQAIEFVTWHEEMNHHQMGDPAKLGLAVSKLAALKDRPIRFVAGSEALAGATKKLGAMVEQISSLKTLSDSTDGTYPDTKHP